MRGRKPKPVARQIAEGDPAKRGPGKLREKLAAEIQTERGIPQCPAHLNGRARTAWNSWKRDLEFMEMDRRPDGQALEGACMGYARAVQADLIIAKEGLTVTESVIDKTGEVVILKIKAHPAVAISNAAWRQVRAFVSEFGFTPVSRTRLSIERKDSNPELELAELLSRPRAPRQPVSSGTVQ